MSNSGLKRSAAVALLGAGGVLAACGSSGSTNANGSTTSTTAASSPPTVGSTPVTLHYFSKSTSQAIYGSDGKPITDPNAAPQVGGYLVSTGLDYVGDHTSHSSAVAGSDHLICQFETVATTPNGSSTLLCNGQIALGGSMLVADHQTVQLSQNSPINLSFTGGTGQYQGVTGTISTQSVGPNSNDTDFTLSVSRSGGSGTSPITSSPPTVGSTPVTLHYFSKSTSQAIYG